MVELFKVRLILYEFFFMFSGVDYFGFFYVKRGRGRVVEKCWGVIFVCLNLCVVYFEVVKFLDIDDFIFVLI